MFTWICCVAAAAEPVAPVQTLTLQQGLERFRAAAPSVAALEAQVDEARHAAQLAGAPLLPRIVARGGYVRHNAEVAVSLPATLVPKSAMGPDPLLIQPLDQWTAGLDATLPLLVPAAWAQRGAGRARLEAAQASAVQAGRTAEAGLVVGAWRAAAAEEVVAATASGADAARAQRDSAQRRLDAGVGTELDVLLADTELSRREGDHVQALAEVSAVRRALGALLDLPGPVRLTVGALPPMPPEAGNTKHPEQRAVEARAQAAARAHRAAWLGHAPQVAASGSVFASDVPLPTGVQTGWRVGVQATWSLFEKGRFAQAGITAARKAQAEAGLRGTNRDLQRRAADAAQAIGVVAERHRLAGQALRTATAAEATAQRLYEAGLGDALQALDAQQRRVDAALALAAARTQVAIARVELALATGS